MEVIEDELSDLEDESVDLTSVPFEIGAFECGSASDTLELTVDEVGRGEKPVELKRSEMVEDIDGVVEYVERSEVVEPIEDCGLDVAGELLVLEFDGRGPVMLFVILVPLGCCKVELPK